MIVLEVYNTVSANLVGKNQGTENVNYTLI